MFKKRSVKRRLRRKDSSDEDEEGGIKDTEVSVPKKQRVVRGISVKSSSSQKPDITSQNFLSGSDQTQHSAASLASVSTGPKIGPKFVGPMNAPANVRVTCQFDYQPDVCKDFYETGYCGYGDSCKFAHIREDYKSGWQLERDWEEKQEREAERAKEWSKEGGDEKDVEDDTNDGFPWACFICRKPFTNPIVTICHHYFCESCAVERYKKDTTCAVCREPTQGIFHTAKEIAERMAAGTLRPPESREKELETKEKLDEEEFTEEEIKQGDRSKNIELSESSWMFPSGKE